MSELIEFARNESLTVTTASQNITQRDEHRQIFILTNYSTGGQVITITFGQVAVAGVGVVLNPGEKYGEADGDNFECYKGVINCISSAAGGTLAVYTRDE